MSGRILRKTEAVAANHNSVLQDHVVPDLAEFTDHRMCVGEKVVTNLHAAIHDHMREQYSVLADFDAVLNYHVRSNVGAVADLGRRMHNRSRMYSRRISRRLIKKFQRTRKIQIRIFAAQHRRTESREVFSDNHSRRFGCPRCRGIFRVGYESNLSWAGGFNSRNTVDFGIWRAILQPSTQPPIDLRKFHFADDCKGRVAANRDTEKETSAQDVGSLCLGGISPRSLRLKAFACRRRSTPQFRHWPQMRRTDVSQASNQIEPCSY